MLPNNWQGSLCVRQGKIDVEAQASNSCRKVKAKDQKVKTSHWLYRKFKSSLSKIKNKNKKNQPEWISEAIKVRYRHGIKTKESQGCWSNKEHLTIQHAHWQECSNKRIQTMKSWTGERAQWLVPAGPSSAPTPVIRQLTAPYSSSMGGSDALLASVSTRTHVYSPLTTTNTHRWKNKRARHGGTNL